MVGIGDTYKLHIGVLRQLPQKSVNVTVLKANDGNFQWLLIFCPDERGRYAG